MDSKKTRKKQISRHDKKRFLYLIVALMLVGGLVLSATFGLIDFLMGGGNPGYPSDEDEFLANLKQWAAYLEESVEDGAAGAEKKAELGNAYYEIAMYHYLMQQVQEMQTYAEKSKGFFLDALDEGFLEPWVPLRMGLLAYLEEDDRQAEEFFKDTLELEDTNPDAHFYLGSIYFSRGLTDKARAHWERVLELVEEGTYAAEAARYYLEISRLNEENLEEENTEGSED